MSFDPSEQEINDNAKKLLNLDTQAQVHTSGMPDVWAEEQLASGAGMMGKVGQMAQNKKFLGMSIGVLGVLFVIMVILGFCFFVLWIVFMFLWGYDKDCGRF